MVMTGHHDKRKQRVSLAGKVKECVLHDLRLAIVGEVSHGAFVVE